MKSQTLPKKLKVADKILDIDYESPYVFKPTERQLKLWEIVRSHNEDGQITLIGYGGAAGGGKTRAIVEMAIDLCLNYPGNRILVGRRDFNDLSSTVMESFFRHVPPQIVAGVNNVQHWVKIRLPTWPKNIHSVVRFRELKDWVGLGSEEYGAVLIDEAAEVSLDSVLMLLSRLRWKLPIEIQRMGVKLPYYFIAATNPFPGWFKDWFVDRKLPEGLMKDAKATVHFIPALARDNPHLPPNYEDFLRSIYPASWVKRLMDGSWDVYIGQVYPQFSKDIHEWKMRQPNGEIFIPQFQFLVGGLDFGEPSNNAHKTAGIVGGVTESGRLIRLDLFEDASPDVYEKLVKWMAAMEEKWTPYLKPKKYNNSGYFLDEYSGQRIIWCADKSQMGWIQEMRKGFIIRPSKGGRGSVRWGIGLVANRLHVDKSGIPGSFYLPHMTKFYDAMVRYRWPEWDETSQPPTTPLKIDDDLVDADRYMHELLPQSLGPPEQFLSQIPRLEDNPEESKEQWIEQRFGLKFRPKAKASDRDLSYLLSFDDEDEIKIF